jgi:hypothetical protein
MTILRREPSVWGAAGPGFILLGLIALLLLPAPARGQSGGGSGVLQHLPPGASEASRLNPGAPDRRLPAPGRVNIWDDPGRPCAREAPPRDSRQSADNLRDSARRLASRPLSGVHQNLPVKPASSGWLPSQCPLPPASVFFLQTNFHKYLETWPKPGSTATGDWPEYLPEDEDNLE